MTLWQIPDTEEDHNSVTIMIFYEDHNSDTHNSNCPEQLSC